MLDQVLQVQNYLILLCQGCQELLFVFAGPLLRLLDVSCLVLFLFLHLLLVLLLELCDLLMQLGFPLQSSVQLLSRIEQLSSLCAELFLEHLRSALAGCLLVLQVLLQFLDVGLVLCIALLQVQNIVLKADNFCLLVIVEFLTDL